MLAPSTKWQIGSFLLQRWVNMTVACWVAVLFIVYPALMTAAVSILDCRSYETVGGEVYVIASDTTVVCSGEAYESARVGAWLVLIGVGLGGPLLSALSVRFVARATCDGSMSAARMVMHFLTGSYSAGTWYWECVVLLRKLLLVMCATLLRGGFGGVLASLWALGIFAYLTLTFQPFESAALQRLDALSLGAIVTMFGLSGLGYVYGPSSWSACATAIGALNLAVFAYIGFLICAVLWRETVDLFWQFLLPSRLQSLDKQAGRLLSTLQSRHSRTYDISDIVVLTNVLVEEARPTLLTRQSTMRLAHHNQKSKSTLMQNQFQNAAMSLLADQQVKKVGNGAATRSSESRALSIVSRSRSVTSGDGSSWLGRAGGADDRAMISFEQVSLQLINRP